MRAAAVANRDSLVAGRIGSVEPTGEERIRKIEEAICRLEDTLNEYGQHIDFLFDKVDILEGLVKEVERRVMG